MQSVKGFLFGLLAILVLIQDVSCHWIGGGWGGPIVVGGFGGFGGYGRGYGRGFGGGFYGPQPLFYPPPPPPPPIFYG